VPAARAQGTTARLDTTENLVIPRSAASAALAAARRAVDVREYPDGGAERLAAAIAGHVGVPARCVVVGSGSDQILDLAVAHLLARRSRVLVTDPTFSFFEARLALHGMRAVRVPFGPDMAVDMGALEGAARGADAIYLDSPNNPTGFQFPERRLRRLIRSFGGLVIIDEAYAAFAGYSLAAMARAQENLAVVGTLSKSFGLAGLRVGYAVMPPAMARAFASVIQYPYPVSSVSIEAAVASLGERGAAAAREAAAAVVSERARLVRGLSAHANIEAFPSQANFVLFDAGGSHRQVHRALAEQGISVRLIGRVGGRRGCLRATVGTREQNSRLLMAIRDIMG